MRICCTVSFVKILKVRTEFDGSTLHHISLTRYTEYYSTFNFDYDGFSNHMYSESFEAIAYTLGT